MTKTKLKLSATIFFILFFSLCAFSLFVISASAETESETPSKEAPPTTVIEGETYYQLDSAEDLYWFAELCNGIDMSVYDETVYDDNIYYYYSHIKYNAILTADITLNENVIADGRLNNDTSGFSTWDSIGFVKTVGQDGGYYKVAAYKGIFDGNGHSISGLYLNDTDATKEGLFGVIAEGGVVKNLTVKDSYICVRSDAGMIAGRNDGTVTGVTTYGIVFVNSYGAAGIAAENHGLIDKCVSHASVLGGQSVYWLGGIAYDNFGTVKNSAIFGDVGSSATYQTGGIVCNNDATIENCYVNAEISGSSMTVAIAVFNQSGATITNCYYNNTLYSGLSTYMDSGTLTNVVGKTNEEFISGDGCTLVGYHAYVDGICASCDDECEHTGGVFNCTVGYICDICHTEYTEPIGHNLGPILWNEEGTEHYSGCINCSYQERDEHGFTKWECANEYVHKKECETCNYEVSAEHNYTWENLGSEHKGKCTDCEYELTEKHHSLTNYRPIDADTHVARCGACNLDITEKHQYSLFEKVDEETHKKYCYNCNNEVVAEHDFNYYTYNGDGDCTVKGTETSLCSTFCGAEHTKDDDLTGNGHSWNEGEVTTYPTCTEEGVKVFTCVHDSAHTYSASIERRGHILVEFLVGYAATCTKSGLTDGSKCLDCGETLVAQTEISPIGHNFIDGKCSICGEKEKDGLSGGAIAGIAGGSTVAVGAGGFSLFWFVIKKRKWSDLVGIFKK